jgi:membrane protein DedA with SNARE-associated domain
MVTSNCNILRYNGPMSNWGLFWKSMRLPLIGAGIVLFLFAGWLLLDLPTEAEFMPVIQSYLESYGLVAVFLASLIEAALILGWYFPGGVVIFFSVAASPTPERAVLVILATTLGLFAGYTLNFFLGKYGWYKLLLRFGIRQQLKDAEQKIARFGVRAIFSSYWMPGLGSMTATAAGVLQYATLTFLWWSWWANLLWCIFWGALVYTLGQNAMQLVLNPVIIVGFIAMWGLIEFWLSYRAARSADSTVR